MLDSANQGNNYVLFVKSNNQYFAFDCYANPIEINLDGALQAGSYITYSGDNEENICWDLQDFKVEDANVNGNFDVLPTSSVTNTHIFPHEEGFFSEDTTWHRPGFNYIHTTAEGYNVDKDIGNIFWSYYEFYISYENGQFEMLDLVDGVTAVPIDESSTFYWAVVESSVNEEINLTAKVLSRDEIYESAAKGYRYVIFARSEGEYFAFDSTGNPQKINLEGNLQKGAIITYDGTDVDNICWEFDTVSGYVALSNIDVTILSCKTGRHMCANADGFFVDGTYNHPGFYYARNPAEGIDQTIANLWWSWISEEACRHVQFTNGEFQSVAADVYANQLTLDDTNAFYVARVYDPSYVVFNPGNGNGIGGADDRPNSLFDYGGNVDLPSVTVDVGYHMNSNNEVSITFPDDASLGTPTNVVTQDALQYTIEREKVYNYKLAGWYNIATGQYYDVSTGPNTATIRVKDSNGNTINNVFYANWFADNYNLGQAREGTQYNAISSENIVTKVFDYNELFNLLSTSVTSNFLLSETWTDIEESTALETSSFIFQNSHAEGSIGYPTNLQDWNKRNIYSAAPRKWPTYDSVNTLFNKLFDESGGTLGVKYLGTGDYLYHKVTDENGNEFYEYDSNKNAASYNQAQQRFYVWDTIQYTNVDGTVTPMFLPFNDEQTTPSSVDGTNNYWFGMTTEITFNLEEKVGTTENRTNQVESSNGSTTDMIFEFSGDDDAWIYIDDVICVDLGGIHDEMSVRINFSTREITIRNHNNEIEDFLRINDAPLIDAELGEHTLKLVYLERNGGDCDYAVTFNLPIEEEPEQPDEPEEIPEKVNVEVTKEWEHKNNVDIPQSVEVTLYDGETAIETVTLNEENNWTYKWKELSGEGKYSVKETEVNSYTDTYELTKGFVETTIESSSGDGTGDSSGENTGDSSSATWTETTVLSDGEFLIINSNLTDGNGTVGSGYFAMNGELGATSITIEEGTVTTSVTNDIIWVAESSGEGFKIKNKGNGKYINITCDVSYNTGMSLVDSVDEATELKLAQTQGVRLSAPFYSTNVSILYKEDNFKAETLWGSTWHDFYCVRVYAKTGGNSSTGGNGNTGGNEVTTITEYVYDYTITNTYIPEVTLKKLDNSNKQPLSDVTFTVTNSEGLYYTENGWTADYSTLTTDSSGLISFSAIEDGQYIITETQTQQGYHMLKTPVTVTVENERITSVEGTLSYIDETDSKGLTLIVENAKGYKLPDTGGIGTNMYIFVGAAIMIISLYVLKRK